MKFNLYNHNKRLLCYSVFSFLLMGIMFYFIPVIGQDSLIVGKNSLLETFNCVLDNHVQGFLPVGLVTVLINSGFWLAFTKALVMTSINILVFKSSKAKNECVYLVIFFFILNMSHNLFSLVYASNIAFFTYALYTAVLFALLYFLKEILLSHKDSNHLKIKCTICLLLGLLCSLFSWEFILFSLTVLAAAFVIWYVHSQKKDYKTVVPFMILLTTIILVCGTLTPYKNISLNYTFSRFKEQYILFSQQFLTLPYLLILSVLCLYIIYKSNKTERLVIKILHITNRLVFTIIPVYSLLFSKVVKSKLTLDAHRKYLILDFLIQVIFIFAVVTTFLFFVESKDYKCYLSFNFIAPLVFIGICTILNKLNEESFFLVYFFNVILTSILLLYARDKGLQFNLSFMRTPIIVAVLFTYAVYVYVLFTAYSVNKIKDSYIKSMMDEGRTFINLPEYNVPINLLPTDKDYMKFKYYYESPGDIEFEYTDFDLWNSYENTVIVVIDGGICSQMKQYMIGQYFVEKGYNVKYDISWYEKCGKDCDRIHERNFELNKAFPYIKINVASEQECDLFKKYTKKYTDLRDVDAPTILDNYYDFSYYLNSESVKKFFKVDVENLNEKSKEVSKEIEAQNNSVAVHVRRGDLKNSSLKTEYFFNSINYVHESHKDACFFFFSDEIEFVNQSILPNLDENIKYKIVDVNKSDVGYMDLFLISMCKHQICSQGTFGKYGAYLGDNEDKMAIVPEEEKRPIEGSLKDFFIMKSDGTIVKYPGED